MAFVNPPIMNINQFRRKDSHPGQGQGKPVLRKAQPQQTPPGGKLMRLKCRFRPLQDAYMADGEIAEKDADVVFVCSDGRIRAHKIILASSSLLFIKMFEDQNSSEMSTVIVPDITIEIMRLILSLAYKDNVNMSPKQVKEVGAFINLFGMTWKQFNCKDTQNPDAPPIQMKCDQSNTVLRQQQQLKQQQRIQFQQLHPRLQQQLQQQGPSSGKSSPTMVFKGGQSNLKVQSTPPPLYKHSVQNQEGQLSAGSDGPDYKFQLQVYGQDQQPQGQHLKSQQMGPNQQKQIAYPAAVRVRPLQQLLTGGQVTQGQVQGQGNRKVLYVGHQTPGESMRGYRRIAPKPMSQGQNQGSEGEMDLYGGVTDQMEIQMETEDSTEEDGNAIDPETGRTMIQEWMQNLGREQSTALKKAVVQGKKLPATVEGKPNKPAHHTSGNQCLICNNTFDDNDKWKWHETHHVGLGIFKCKFCDELFSTSRKVYQHEMMEHGVITNDGPAEPPTIPEDFQIVNGRKRKLGAMEDGNPNSGGIRRPHIERLTLVRTIHGSHYRKLPGSGPSMKRKIALAKVSRANLVKVNLRARNPNIGIAHMEDEDAEETKKIRQLHWIYVCSKCEHGVDSSQKAQQHYKMCYPDKEMPFESTVVKYRQGFFGKIKCPICPRRYTSAAGFKIHCGHMHEDYRRKFSHSNTDDTIVCRICQKRFKDPVDFHYHLSDGECYDAPEFDKNEAKGRWVGNGNPGAGEESNSPPKLKKEKSIPTATVTTSSAPTTPTTPPAPPAPHSSSSLSRSTRLTNRILMNSEDGGENKFSAVTCPVCGTAAVEKIVEHLQTEHSDLDVLVSRVGNGLLRCQKCRITFALCDLLAHYDHCEGTKLFQHASERRAAQAGSKARVSGATAAGTSIVIPPGIGCSPIDKIECEDLSSVETLKAAMKCGVCGNTAKKLGVIADCLRSHGIHRCALCFNTYNEKSLYSMHLRSAHSGGGGRLLCPLCPKTFSNAGQVAGHMYSNHWMASLGKDMVGKSGVPRFQKVEKPAAKTEESDGDQAILAAVGLTAATPAIAKQKDDYSNITLGSILSSSQEAFEKLERGERELNDSIEVVPNNEIATATEPNVEGEGLQIVENVAE